MGTYGVGMDDSVARAPVSSLAWKGFGVGVAGALFGLLPWLVSGERLPLQNLWATAVLPADMPWVMLPLNQYLVGRIVAMLAIGGFFAGLSSRLWGSAAQRPWTRLGVLLVHLIAVGQSMAVLAAGLTPGRLTTAYLAVLLAFCLAGVALAQLLFWVSAPQRWRAALGIALTALVLPSWLMEWALTAFGETAVPIPLTSALMWLSPLIVGGALAWCGLGGVTRAITWIVGLAGLWLLPIMTAALGGASSRVAIGQGPASMISTALFYAESAITRPPVEVAIAATIGVIGAIVQWWRGRRSR